MSRFTSRFNVACLFISLLAIANNAAAAASRPYSARGTAQFTSQTEFVGSGQATHLGAYREAGTVSFAPTSDPNVLHVDGSIVYTAANGDELHANVNGELNTATGAVTANLTYVGGSGRFSDASGSSSLSGRLGPGGTISVAVSGSLSY